MEPKAKDLTEDFKKQHPEVAKNFEEAQKLNEAMKNLDPSLIDVSGAVVKLTESDLKLLGATKKATKATTDFTPKLSDAEQAAKDLAEAIKKIEMEVRGSIRSARVEAGQIHLSSLHGETEAAVFPRDQREAGALRYPVQNLPHSGLDIG